MKIIFKTDQPVKELTFNDVTVNQFFVDADGDLCQKYDHSTYTIIAKNTGRPCSMFVEAVDYTKPIKRILPIVERIEF